MISSPIHTAGRAAETLSGGDDAMGVACLLA